MVELAMVAYCFNTLFNGSDMRFDLFLDPSLLKDNWCNIHVELQTIENKNSIFYVDNFPHLLFGFVPTIKTDFVLSQNIPQANQIKFDVAAECPAILFVLNLC